MDMEWSLVAIIGAVMLLAGFVKGVIGLGLPTVGVGLLGMVMAPASAAALMVVPNFVTNIAQGLFGEHRARLLRRLWPLLVAMFAGTLLAAPLTAHTGAPLFVGLLGLALVVYAAVGLLQIRFHVRADAEGWAGPLVGLVTGAVTAATGVFVIPAVPYLQSLGLEKDELVQALGLFFLTATVALAIALGANGLLSLWTLAASGAALIPAWAGMRFGQGVRARISQATFRTWFLLGLAALGVALLARALF